MCVLPTGCHKLVTDFTVVGCHRHTCMCRWAASCNLSDLRLAVHVSQLAYCQYYQQLGCYITLGTQGGVLPLHAGHNTTKILT